MLTEFQVEAASSSTSESWEETLRTHSHEDQDDPGIHALPPVSELDGHCIQHTSECRACASGGEVLLGTQ